MNSGMKLDDIPRTNLQTSGSIMMDEIIHFVEFVKALSEPMKFLLGPTGR